MNKNPLSTYQFPRHLERQYHLLMKSKENFLKKLIPAEQRKLETSYSLLKNAWDQNHTEQLKNFLDEKYQELREIQKQNENGQVEYKKELTYKWNLNLEEKWTDLEMKKIQLQLKKKTFENTVKIWKTDIIKKEKNWSEKRQRLENELKQKLEQKDLEALMLKEEKENLENKQKQLNDLLLRKKQLSDNLNSTLKSSQNELNEKKPIIEKKLSDLKRTKNELAKSYESQLQTYRIDLKKHEETLKEDSNKKILEMLRELRIEMEAESQNFPDQLREYWRTGDFLTITKMNSTLQNDIIKLTNALKKGVTKIGKTSEEFMAWMDQNS